MEFGTMKSMCYPNPLVVSDMFTNEGYRYHFIIENDWGPCSIKNLDTGKIRKNKIFRIR